MDSELNDFTSDTLFEAIASSNLAHTLSSVEGDRPLIYVNQAFLDETGYERGEVIGKNCRFLQGEGTDAQTVQKIRASLDNFEPIDIEILNYRKDGTPFLNRLRMSTVFDATGKPLAYMGIQSNVNTLVENVRVAQEKYKMESLGRLSANVSHEVKNALQPIKLMLESLENVADMPADQATRCVEIAMENMVVAENIVKDMLSFSRQDHTEKEKILATELVDNTLRFTKNLVPKTAAIELNLSEECEHNAVYLEVHQNGIFQIITNLINNALDASNHKGKLLLGASMVNMQPLNDHGLQEGQYFALTITDSGGGIDEAVLGNIFQPFFSTKSPGEGTGLGLAVSIKIAKDHGGTMTAANVKGGAEFSLLLPAIKA